MSKKKHTVETALTPEHYRKFLKVKERFGVVSNASALCILIAEEYDRIRKGEEGRKEYERWVKMHQKS